MIVRAAAASGPSASQAVARLADRLPPPGGAVTFAFVPAGYDQDEAAAALTEWAGPGLLGCTSAGAVGPSGYSPDEIAAITLSQGDLRARTIVLRSLDDMAKTLATAGTQLAAARSELGEGSMFAVLLCDGLSLQEEVLAEGLRTVLGDIPLIGGSAGDDLRFERSAVLMEGHFVSGAATVTLMTTPAPWRRFRVQHHLAGDAIAVVTDADPAQRLVHSLNGRSAAAEYAALAGVGQNALGPATFSTYPLVLRAGGGEWVRSVCRAEPDGSLRLFSAAERGSVLRIGRSIDPEQALSQTLSDLDRQLAGIGGMLVFDCILRRLEFEELHLDTRMGELLARYHGAGFSTYGEQFDGVHVNQTLVGVAFGA